MNVLIAANSLGFDAQWLTGWYCYDNNSKPVFGLENHERFSGIIHIGTSDAEKTERGRPNLSQIFKTL